MVQPKSNIVHLPVYQPGKPIEAVKREYGLSEIIKLASNENPYGCSPKAKEAVVAEMDQTSLYPDGAAVELTETLAAHFGVKPDQLIFGAGSDEVILMICRAFLTKDDETIAADCTFPQYKHNVVVEGARMIEVPLKDGKHDLPGMLAAVTERTKIVWICNPNNPTGTIVSQDELEAFLARLPANVMVALDEAYAEYVTDPSYPDGLELLRRHENVVLLRTFSKIYGLASLRIGYAIGHPGVIRSINQVREPFNTTRYAQAAAKAALRDQAFVDGCRTRNREGIAYLQEQFVELGLSYFPAHGNFIMVDVRRPGQHVFQDLLKQGIIIRFDASWGYPNRVRVTVGSRKQNETFIQALKKTLSEIPAKV